MSIDAAHQPNSPPEKLDSESLGPPRDVSTRSALIPLWQRIALFLIGAGLIVLLVTAARLPPNPAGIGTHQGLGLPACSIVVWFGVRCPACGMTTSWAHLLRGQILESAAANTGGMLLALAAIVGAPWMVASAIRGRWWLGALTPEWMLVGCVVITFVTTVQWCWRLFA